MKILIITNGKDDHARVVADGLERRGCTLIRWMSEEFLFNQKSKLHIGATGQISSKINSNNLTINFEEIDVVWLRRPAYPRMPRNISNQDRRFIIDENRINLKTLWFMLEKMARWANPFSSARIFCTLG
ncbi:MAG: hypothetical protein U1E78_07065 [Gammaproteobacteria bacterium]